MKKERRMTSERKELTLLPEINEKEVQQFVIKELKQYRALKIQIENRKEPGCWCSRFIPKTDRAAE
jgi:hypothetical protein